jgi:YD repeat-containing protein
MPVYNKNRDIYAGNHIKSQVSLDYTYSGNKPVKTGIKTSVTDFSVGGDVTRVTTFNPKGQVINIEKYSYDARGNKTGYCRYSGDTESRAAYEKISVYNDFNLLVEENGYDGIENFKNSYVYNGQDEITAISYMKNGILSEKRVFSRNDNVTTVSIFNKSGTMTSKLMLTYDSHKNLIQEAVYGVNESELEKKTYDYDENRNLKEVANYKLDKITLKTNYNYNTAGDLIEITEETPVSARFTKKRLSYDADGNLIEIKWRRKESEDFNSITYAYDEKGLSSTAITWYPATKYRVMTRYTYEKY